MKQTDKLNVHLLFHVQNMKIEEALKMIHKDSEFVGVVNRWIKHAYSDDNN